MRFDRTIDNDKGLVIVNDVQYGGFKRSRLSDTRLARLKGLRDTGRAPARTYRDLEA